MNLSDSHVVVVDLGFGDAGKGTIVDWLCAAGNHRTVVRFNGGAQAAHNVVTADGHHHTFAQFGAGTFTPGVRTHLSRYVLVDPLALAAEADHLAELGVTDALDRISVDARALLVTPWHRAANQARERARGARRHGSCGMGIGETARYALDHPDDAPTVDDCRHPDRLRHRLALLADRLGPVIGTDPALPDLSSAVAVFADFARAVAVTDAHHLPRLLAREPVVFEGAQGVLLDEDRGFHPYTTWSTTTTRNALDLVDESGTDIPVTRLGVLRTYTTRHGPGPLVTDDPALAAALPEPHNGTGQWQGAFRSGPFDAVAHRYALAATGGVDALALTHLDAAERVALPVCRRYRLVDGAPWQPEPPVTPDPDRQARLTATLATVTGDREPGPDRARDWPGFVTDELGTPVAVVSHGPTAADKRVIGAG